MKPDMTYCLGYWHIKNNVKRDISHYLGLIPRTLEMLKNKNIVLFYYDEDILEFVKKHLKTDKFKLIKVDVTDLPTYSLSQYYLESCKNQNNIELERLECQNEKGLKHYNRDYLQSGEDSYRMLITIWTSKLYLLERVIEENPFHTEYFSWLDASISRLNHKRENWDFTKQVYSREFIYHYKNIMAYYGQTLNLSAGFLAGHEDKWLKLIPLYKRQLEKSKNSNYAHDEETMLNIIFAENDGLFKKIEGEFSLLKKVRNKLLSMLR